MRRVFGVLCVAVVAMLIVMLARTLALPAADSAPVRVATVNVDAAAAAQRLAGALRIATVSTSVDSATEAAAFAEFHAYLQAQYPRVFSALAHETVNRHSLLLRWPGSGAADPVLLLGHSDVVPVEAGTESDWAQPPFSGALADGHVWGRGALDNKNGVLGWLEAVDALLAAGFQPKADLWFAFGHDEEIGGGDGAVAMAELLNDRGLRFGVAIDEGGVITRGVVPGVDAPVASIMSGEKGYVSLRLSADSDGGHSSAPPHPTATGRIARAVARLEAQQMPRRLSLPVAAMFERLAPHLGFGARLAVANRWLLEGVLLKQLGRTRVGNALTRTTTAPTMFSPGTKDNVLQATAWAVVNFRILPGDSVASVEAHVRRVIDDPAIRIERISAFVSEPSPVSPIDTPAFEAIGAAVHDVMPDAVISTGVVTGATDLRHYEGIIDLRYNFTPVVLEADDVPRIHGRDERISIDTYADLVRIKTRMLQRLAGAD